VGNLFEVQILETQNNLSDNCPGLRLGEGACFLDFVGERVSAKQFCHNGDVAVVFQQVVNLHYARVVEAGQDFKFSVDQFPEERLVGEHSFFDQLYGHYRCV